MQVGFMKQIENNEVGFIGIGIMGQGMAHNLLKAGKSLYVMANQNRQPVEELKNIGAIELSSVVEIARKCSAIILCLPNSSIDLSTVRTITSNMRPGGLIIDCTTNDAETVRLNALTCKKSDMRYVEAPLAGGQQQSHDGKLGAIVGCSIDNFDAVKELLSPCCDVIERFGDVGMAAKAKLVSNFLALGTATLVVEAMKVAKTLEIDWNQFYEIAKRGSGNSMSLERIAPNATQGNYDGYVFSISNTVKDLQYITNLLKGHGDAERIAELLLDIYQKSLNSGNQNRNLSARLDPNFLTNEKLIN